MLKIIINLFVFNVSTTAFAQSALRFINFNLTDLKVWSQPMRKFDLTKIMDSSGNKFELTTFKSADNAFRDPEDVSGLNALVAAKSTKNITQQHKAWKLKQTDLAKKFRY